MLRIHQIRLREKQKSRWKRLCVGVGGSRQELVGVEKERVTNWFRTFLFCSSLLYFFFVLMSFLVTFFSPWPITKAALTFLKSSCGKILSKQFCMKETDTRQETRETKPYMFHFCKNRAYKTGWTEDLFLWKEEERNIHHQVSEMLQPSATS